MTPFPSSGESCEPQSLDASRPGIEADPRRLTTCLGNIVIPALATIVLAVLVIHERLPGNDTIIVAAGWTLLLSVVAHGVTANPLVKKMAVRSAELAA